VRCKTFKKYIYSKLDYTFAIFVFNGAGSGYVALCLDIVHLWSDITVPGARFEVFTVLTNQIKVFWVVIPCSVAIGYQCFREPCYLHFHPEVRGIKVLYNSGTLPQHYEGVSKSLWTALITKYMPTTINTH
jgi:hypothetical protein